VSTYTSTPQYFFRACCLVRNTYDGEVLMALRECIQKFPDWSPGARIVNGSSLPLGAVVSQFGELV